MSSRDHGLCLLKESEFLSSYSGYAADWVVGNSGLITGRGKKFFCSPNCPD